MKKVILILLIQVGLLTACKQTNQKDDPEKLKAVLVDYFDGIKTKDFQKMKDLTTNDFVLYEDGKIFNNDSLIKVINSFPKFTAEYKFDNFDITVDNSSGNMSFLNHGQFVFNDTTHVSFNWLESATFKKVDDKWKLDFLHSTVRK